MEFYLYLYSAEGLNWSIVPHLKKLAVIPFKEVSLREHIYPELMNMEV